MIDIDIIRVSADSEQAFTQLDKVKAQLHMPKTYSLETDKECHGFWRQIAGISAT